ncbi:hypothetical protein ACTAQI_07545 [Pseudarthrobacter sp. alpha12b]
MPSTLKYGITYPSGTVAPNVPIVMQQQAESVDAAIGKAAGLKHAEFTGPTQLSNANVGITFGTLSADATKTVNNTFAVGGTGGQITMSEAGVYIITSMATPDSDPGNVHMWATSAGVLVASEAHISYGSNLHTICFTLRLTQGATLALGVTTAVTRYIDTRVKITKIQNG